MERLHMNTKEAAEKFKLDIQEVRNRKGDGMILGARIVKRRIVIPDDTVIIPSKQDIQAFLLEILKHKNNPGSTISRKLCTDEESLRFVVEYVYRRGFIGEFEFQPGINNLFQSLSLTDEGLAFVIGAGRLNQMVTYSIHPITLNPELKIGLINIG